MSLVKNVLNVGIATAASRVLGFVRDVLVASTLGAGPVADAFVVAFRLPNLFRRLFAEGAFNSAFVPLYAKKVDGESDASAKLFAEEVMAIMFWALAIFSAVMMLAMPLLVDVLAPGFSSDPAKYDLTVTYTRICFPYLLCMSVLAILAGVLNSNRRFGFAAWAPLLLNLILSTSLVAAGALGYAGTPTAGLFLSWAVFIAGFAQVALLAVILKIHGLGLGIRRPRFTPWRKAHVCPWHSRCDCGRDYADQSGDRDNDRLHAACCRVMALLCRPDLSIPARHGGCCHRRRAAA